MQSLGIYKLHPTVQCPSLETENSACVDVYAYLKNSTIVTYDRYNNKSTTTTDENTVGIRIGPKERILIPTGIIFDIPEHYSLRMHPRSGLSIKKGLILANCEGVIDSDYVEELMIPVVNTSDISYDISHSERIAQIELVRKEYFTYLHLRERPEQKTDRSGGFGSTGV
jgi:dUTP pyrophosphatase